MGLIRFAKTSQMIQENRKIGWQNKHGKMLPTGKFRSRTYGCLLFYLVIYLGLKFLKELEAKSPS